METGVTIYAARPSYPPPFSPSHSNRGKEMNSVKATTKISFPPPNSCFSDHPRRSPPSIKNSTLCFSGSGGATPPDGDKQRQELLAKIAMLQTQKVRLTDFLDDRSAYLSKFAEDANAEFDDIGENALKDLEEAGSRIMESLENRMQSFEETAEMSRRETEEKEKAVEDIEDRMERDRNEGLFFKNLGEKPPRAKAEAKVQVQKLREVTRKSSGPKMRRNIYVALMCLLLLTIGNAVIASPDVEWRKIGALGLIFMGLLAQLIYEQSMSSTNEKREEEELPRDK